MANIIISKIESKSQLHRQLPCVTFCCGKYHYFKDRKQITTPPLPDGLVMSCGKYHYFKDRKQITTLLRGRVLR
ncbi:MAG TPA: hypothetical protein PK037_05495, partial [Saprospiraceae bacterium]|nr:hypothetical protein [Saprospiraceae bacterium]